MPQGFAQFRSKTLLTIAALVFVCGCQTQPTNKAVAPTTSEPAWFVEKAAVSGLNFLHENGATGTYYLPEIMGAGSAFFDYDRDGDLDIFLVQSGPFPLQPGNPAHGDKLFRNDSPAGANADQLKFTDVTDGSGILALGYGMGVAIADIDRDGWLDVYITNVGDNQLWRNLGNGTFENITEKAGANDSGWGISASFCDYDGDGWPDLLVGNYAIFTAEKHRPCYGPVLDYCHPRTYEPQGNRLLRNRGDGTFEDLTQASGMAALQGRTLGIVAADFNGDQRQDFYVANDAQVNFLWVNQGDGTFRETGLFSGAALNLTGQPESSMGVDAADFDEDGDEDLFLSHLRKETNTLYCNDGSGFFEDCSNPTGLGQSSLAFTGFGAGWADLDRDGLLDLFVSNGAVAIIEDLAQAGDPFPYHQTNQIFRQIAPGRFSDETQRMGALAAQSEVSRGATFGDIDNDGDIDILVTNNDGPARLYVNQANPENKWLGFTLDGGSNHVFTGNTRIMITYQDGSVRMRRSRRDGSYLCSNDGRVLVGLGSAGAVEKVKIIWPNGRHTELLQPQLNRYHKIVYAADSARSQEPLP